MPNSEKMNEIIERLTFESISRKRSCDSNHVYRSDDKNESTFDHFTTWQKLSVSMIDQNLHEIHLGTARLKKSEEDEVVPVLQICEKSDDLTKVVVE